MRIVSLLPSATDIVCSLGLRDLLVGRTHECDWPPGIEDVPVMTRDALATHGMGSREIHDAVGGAVHSGSSIYELDVEALDSARPDLILTQELCEVCAVSYGEVDRAARSLYSPRPSVVSLEPRRIEDILGHIELVGELTSTQRAARDLVAELRERLGRLRASTPGREVVRVFCCEWLDPPFAAGHWVPEQVELAGGVEVLGRVGETSHIVTWDDVRAAGPEVIVLMPCGVPIDRTLSEVPSLPRLPARTCVVDGSSFFNRPGPRVVRGAEILSAILHGGPLDPEEARLYT